LDDVLNNALDGVGDLALNNLLNWVWNGLLDNLFIRDRYSYPLNSRGRDGHLGVVDGGRSNNSGGSLDDGASEMTAVDHTVSSI